MELRDRPLLVDGIDAAAYAPRQIEAALFSAVTAGRNALLLGEPGTGKTTLLRWLRARLREQGRRCAFVNASLATDVFAFAELVGDALEEAFAGRADAQIVPPVKSGETVPRAVRLLHEVRRLTTPEPVVLLVDDLADADIAHDWFGRLRDEVWALGHTWALTARPSQSGALRTPPADAFWSAVLEVGPLTGEERAALLERGLEPAQRARIPESSLPPSATPRELIRFLHQALDDSTPRGAWVVDSSRWRHDRAAALGRSEHITLVELESVGQPVSAHDDRLLRRLGWSRPYTQRMLARLEGAGLVRVISERSGAHGRPRKLYEPAPYPMEGT